MAADFFCSLFRASFFCSLSCTGVQLPCSSSGCGSASCDDGDDGQPGASPDEPELPVDTLSSSSWPSTNRRRSFRSRLRWCLRFRASALAAKACAAEAARCLPCASSSILPTFSASSSSSSSDFGRRSHHTPSAAASTATPSTCTHPNVSRCCPIFPRRGRTSNDGQCSWSPWRSWAMAASREAASSAFASATILSRSIGGGGGSFGCCS